ncbi:retrovirus-related pol polyprotein from transposon TNT 1-94 [Tanacetum coccineum]|uniref:Retrovirus-related pol polyprotein from transposon TNT 1-94 n=1 Tax=Tanacetum coccineum TaxID=301880 RepID=A0ABQ5DG64_9ASTR
MIQVRLKVPVRRIITNNGTEFVNQTLREYYEKVGISHETSVARSPQQNGVVERRNRTLIEAARTMLIYAKAPLFLCTKAVAIACYTQNRSIIRLRHGKIPYELLHDKPPELSFLYVFGALCYLTDNSENLGKLQPKADIDFDELTAMASEQSSSGPALHDMTPATISSGLVSNPPPSTLFDLPAPKVIAPIDEVVALVLVVSTEDNHDVEVAHMGNDPYFGILIPEVPSDQSSSTDSIHTIKRYVGQSDGFVDPDTPIRIQRKKALQRIFKYIRGTVNKGLWYPKDSSIALTAYAYADNAGCQDIRRSTSGCMQLLGDRLLTDYGLGFNKIPMYCDNKSAIALSCNNVQHSRSKHIDIRFHFIKEHVENGVIELYFVNTEYQLADIFTKALARERIEFLINKLGMRSFTPETLKQLAYEVDE